MSKLCMIILNYNDWPTALSLADEVKAVSYTHLDVYKRQEWWAVIFTQKSGSQTVNMWITFIRFLWLWIKRRTGRL